MSVNEVEISGLTVSTTDSEVWRPHSRAVQDRALAQ